MTVETPRPGVRLLCVAGQLDRPAAARVLRLVGIQLELITASRRSPACLVIDLGEVSSVEPGGLESLRHAPYSAACRGVAVHLSGCVGRTNLLPRRTRELLREFSTFPTAEQAVRTLTGTAP